MKATNLIQLSLFDTPTLNALRPIGDYINQRCNNCQFIKRKTYGNRSFFYCGNESSKMTNNGLKKIKANDIACSQFKALPKAVLMVNDNQYIGKGEVNFRNVNLVNRIGEARIFKNKYKALAFTFLLGFDCEIVLI